ncbi:unnamed protein product [Pedinophyceae sp. YPF-701]|nr:unnamed protein product [Pedinophyceae sp. YPF-701]
MVVTRRVARAAQESHGNGAAPETDADALKRAAREEASRAPSRRRPRGKSVTRPIPEAVMETLDRLLHYREIPPFLQDNPFIHGGYRPVTTVKSAFRSVFKIHNETLNIWTHLAGCLWFFVLTCTFAVSGPTELYERAVPTFHRMHEILIARVVRMDREWWTVHRWPVFLYMAAVCLCLSLSSLCHSLYCCAQHVSDFMWQFDYLGITTLIVASKVPVFYYGFACEPNWRILYLSISAAMGALGVALSVVPFFRKPGLHTMRAVCYIGMGVWGAAPAIHFLMLHLHDPENSGWEHVRSAFHLIVAQGAIYILGAVFYAGRIPERFFPGKFDIVGHSHQIFHVAVVLAAFVHYEAVVLLLHWRETHGCPEFGPGAMRPR